MQLSNDQLYRNFFETSPDIIFIVDNRSNEIADANQAACACYGYSREEFKRLTLANISCESRDPLIVYHCKKDGTQFPVELNVTSFSSNGNTYDTTFVKDISNLEDSRQFLNDSIFFFNALLENSPLAITILDSFSNVRMWNHSAEQMFGWTAEEVLGKPNPIVPKEKAAEYQALTQELEQNKKIVSRKIVRQRKDCSIIHLNLSCSIIQGKDNQVIGRMAILEDISDKVHAEESLKENEIIFSSFLENSPLYIFFKDKDIRALRLSKNFEQMIGMPVENALGKTMNELFPSDLSARMVADDLRILHEGKLFEVVEELNERTFKTLKFPIYKDGEPFMLAGFTQDITEQKQLTEQLEMLKHSIDIHFDGAYWMDSDNKFVYVNDAGCHMLQYTREELLLMHVSDVNPNASQQVLDKVWQKLRSEGSYMNESTHRRKDGTEFPVEITSTYVKFGNKEYNCGFARDITDRVAFQEALKRNEQQLRHALEGANDGIWDVNMKTGAVYLSPRGCEILGYQPEEMSEIAQTWSDIVCPDDLALTHDRLNAYLQGQAQIFEVEQRLRMKSGEWKWILTRGKALELFSDGRPARMIGTHTDISNRKQIEAALKTSEEKYRSLFENMTVGFALHEMIFDDSGNPLDYRFLEINPAFEKLTGLNASIIVGKSVKEVISNIEQYWIDFYGEVVKTGIPKSYQNFVAEFNKFYDVWVFSPKGNQFATIFNDITGQKLIQEALTHQNDEYQSLNEEYLSLNEELLERNERLDRFNKELEKAKAKAEESDKLKTAFLCNMSHEIRTPMNAILGFTEFIFQPDLPQEKKDRFSKLIKSRTYDLLRIIEDILDISKIEIGQMSIVESKVNVHELLKDLLAYYISRKESQKPDANIRISLSTTFRASEVIINADGQRLKQILMNLMDNSLKFTASGSIELGCKRDSANNTLVFSVRDTGIGIAADKQQLIFDRFRQADDFYTARHFGGTGLGLSIAKGLTLLMGGQIWLESEVDVGTTFYVSIPYKPAKTEIQKDDESQDLFTFDWPNHTILIVEDDEISAELLNEFISVTKAHTINAYSGAEAMEAFRTTPNLSVVLLDIRLPDTNGFEVARQMKALRPQVPIIAQTAYASETDCRDCMDAGCDSYIAKPIQMGKLLELLATFIANTGNS